MANGQMIMTDLKFAAKVQKTIVGKACGEKSEKSMSMGAVCGHSNCQHPVQSSAAVDTQKAGFIRTPRPNPAECIIRV